jgi:uncharacterized protein YdaU (DUF1376 family)
MPFYIADYLRKTMHLTRDQHGAYMLLLMACWDRGGRLPNDAGQLAGIAKASPLEWRKLRPVILPFFEVDGDSLVQPRVIEEHEKASRLSEIRRQAGSQGGRPKKPIGSEDAKPNGSENGGQTKANGLQTETPAGVRSSPSPLTGPTDLSVSDETVSDGLRKADLDELWALTPAKGRERSSRKDMERSLRSALKRGHRLTDVRAAIEAYYASREATKDGGDYAKGIHRLIENDRWTAFATAEAAPTTAWNSGITAPDEQRQRAWMRDWVEHPSWWKPGDRGPAPGREGCRIAPEIQREFGVEPAEAVAA